MAPSLGGRVWTAVPALSAPLTILGVEKRWFLLSLITSVAAMNLFAAFLGPLVLFAGSYGLGLLAHYRDPEMLRIVANSARYRARYDPGKLAERPKAVEVSG